MRKLLLVLAFLTLGGWALAQPWNGNPGARRPIVVEARLEDEAITPVTARYLERAIREAEVTDAQCLIVVLDTPGGLLNSTRSMVKQILNSKTPVVVYVAPSGGRAASAGMFITMSAHVAAMAPGTNIGAAHPAQIPGLPGGAPQQQDKGDDVMSEKIVNDTVAWVRSLAELRGRNADWAAQAVEESVSVSAKTALEKKVIDLTAIDMHDLLRQLDGRKVRMPGGEVTLHTADVQVRAVDMWFGERALGVLANPTLAIILLMLGFYGVVMEFFTPGWGVPGTVGAICLALGFFALAVLPINFVGVALIFAAFAMFVAEAFVTSYGFLAIGGVISLTLGGLMLVDSPAGFQGVSLSVMAPLALGTGGIAVFLVQRVVRAHTARAKTGGDALIGMAAQAREEFVKSGKDYEGDVFVHGEWWHAESAVPIAALQMVEVESRDGLTLRVRPAATEKSATDETRMEHG